MPMRFQHSRRAFTLVELMISLGIALLLIYGINLIFRAVTDTIKTGNALASATRRMRGIETTFVSDFEGQQYDRTLKASLPSSILPDKRMTGIIATETVDPTSINPAPSDQARQPAITIFNRRQVGFTSIADRDADVDDGLPETADLNDDGTVENYSYLANPALGAVLNRRVHRLDTLSFFAGGTFVPKAGRFGSAGSIYQDLDPFPEAWVWYGHALQPGGTDSPLLTKYADFRPLPTGKFHQPGVSTVVGGVETNTRNFFAGDWLLTRAVMCVKWRDPGLVPAAAGYLRVNQTTGRHYAFFGENTTYPTAIGVGNVDVRPSGTGLVALGPPVGVPVDDAAVTPAAPFNSSLNDVIGVVPGGYNTAVQTAVGAFNNVGATYDPATASGLLQRFGANPMWWQGTALQSTTPLLPLRFNAMSAIAKPAKADGEVNLREKSAIVAPFLASGCTKFVVEFAGDFVTQAPNGNVSNAGSFGPDGETDFDVVGGVRQTQWYGLERDVDGDGVATADANGQAGGDVVPAFRKAKATRPITGSFERAYAAGSDYLVAFGPAELYAPAPLKPTLIRITVTLVDSGGNLANGFTRQMIFKVR